MPSIKLMARDGVVFDKDVDMEGILRCSVSIRTLVEDLGLEEGEEVVIPLPNVGSYILKKVIAWTKHHKDDPPHPPAEDDGNNGRTVEISIWDQDFLKVHHETLFELILAANSLDIKGLLNVASKTAASLIRDQHPEQIRRNFNLKNDFTAEEEEQIRRENEWFTLM